MIFSSLTLSINSVFYTCWSPIVAEWRNDGNFFYAFFLQTSYLHNLLLYNSLIHKGKQQNSFNKSINQETVPYRHPYC